MAKARSDAAPVPAMPVIPPRGLSRLESARHVGVSASYFDQLVRDGLMPKPKRVGARVIWDRVKLEAFFEALPEEGESMGSSNDSFADWQ